MYGRYDPGGIYPHHSTEVREHGGDEGCGPHHYPPFRHDPFHHHQHGHHHLPYPEKCLPAVALLAQAAELALAAPGAVAWCAADLVKGAAGFAGHVVRDCICGGWPAWQDPCCHHKKWHECCSHPECHPDPCCHPKPLEFCRPGTDLSVKARESEKRISSILVENNMPDTVTITPVADAWRDAWGHAISGGDIGFEPETLPLETHKSGTILAITEIDPDTFEGGKLYYTQIHLEGSRAKPLSVSLSVIRESQQDAFVRTDPRHCREGGWLEVCRDPDYPWWFRCHKCGSSPCRCGSHRHEPWWLPCEWHWLGGHHEWS